MATLFVANISKHRWKFQFRFPEKQQAGAIPLGPMSQEIIGMGLSPEDIEAVVARYRPYGMVEWREARKSKTFVGLCYSIDEPIKIDVFFETQETNDAAVDATAAKVNEESAVALMTMLEDEMGKPVTRVEVENVESVKFGAPKTGSGVEVVREGVQPKHQGGNVVVKK